MMRLAFPTLLALASMGPLGTACGDDPETIIDITVVETLPVEFGAMQGGVLEAATFPLADLRDEAAFADAQADLRCASVDARASKLVVTALSVGAGATVIDYRVGVRARGAGAFTELARFAGSVTQGQTVALDASGVTMSATGLQALSQVVLGASPILDVEVAASVPGGVDGLTIELELVMVMSSNTKSCPSTTTGL